MRKITEKAVDAFYLGNDFKMGNTEVEQDYGFIKMFLHNNKIAELYKAELYLSHCGYKTQTTKERLNGLLSSIGYIRQKKGKWFLIVDGVEYIFDKVKSVNIHTKRVSFA